MAALPVVEERARQNLSIAPLLRPSPIDPNDGLTKQLKQLDVKHSRVREGGLEPPRP